MRIKHIDSGEQSQLDRCMSTFDLTALGKFLLKNWIFVVIFNVNWLILFFQASEVHLVWEFMFLPVKLPAKLPDRL